MQPNISIGLRISRDSAISFLYFEILYQLGDRAKIETEIRRLTALNNLLTDAGFSDFVYMDFCEVTIELLQKTIDAILNGSGDDFLVESFNDEDVSSAIIMHFRVSFLLLLLNLMEDDTNFIHWWGLVTQSNSILALDQCVYEDKCRPLCTLSAISCGPVLCYSSGTIQS
jgi:hypothetical protein